MATLNFVVLNKAIKNQLLNFWYGLCNVIRGCSATCEKVNQFEVIAVQQYYEFLND